MSQTPIGLNLINYQSFPGSAYEPTPGPVFGPYLNTSPTVDLTKATETVDLTKATTEEKPEEIKKTINPLLKPILSPFVSQENQADVELNYDASAVGEAIDVSGLDLFFPEEADKYPEEITETRFQFLPGASSPVYRGTKLDSGPVYQARKSSYVPYFQSTKSNTTGEAPSYISKSRPSSKSSFTSDAPPSYINKKSIEDPFDQSFGFISPSYISRNRKTQERIVPTSAPSYISKDRKPKESTQPTQSPSYISREYLRRASRY